MSHFLRHLSSDTWTGIHALGVHLAHLASDTWTRVTR